LAQDEDPVATFIKRWERSEGGEHRTYVMFLTELCEVLGVDGPKPDDEDYGFERRVDLAQWDGTLRRGRIDLYKRGCFVLEAKQGSFKPAPELPIIPGLAEIRAKRKKGAGHGVRGSKTWDDSMLRARAQARRYAENLPDKEGIPPFLIVVDIGYSFELFANFSKTRFNYTQFPDGRRFRFRIGDLADPDIRERLRKVWTDPWSLDPARESARVTRHIADKLARLAQSLERDHAAKSVADFLMRCLFTMFAEDSPSQAANCRPVSKRPGSPMVATMALAMRGPTPGMVAIRQLSALPRCQARISRSRASILASVSRHCAAMCGRPLRCKVNLHLIASPVRGSHVSGLFGQSRCCGNTATSRKATRSWPGARCNWPAMTRAAP
jgi:hypothetical protein